MNSITELLNLEDADIFISDITISGTKKILTLETHPIIHFCPICGFKMHSRGIKTRTINHPILQDTYELILKLKQRRWRCTNPQCSYTANETFNFVNKRRRVTNATDMLIINAFRDLSISASSIAEKFNVSDTYVLETFDRFVKTEQLPLTDIISVDEVFLELDDHCKYALVIQDFYTGNPMFIDFANLLIRNHDYIINSFVMVEKHGPGKIYSSRLSNGPIESLNRKVKDLKRQGRGYRNFEHFRTRFLYATRDNPVINGVTDYNPVTYYDMGEE